MELISVFSIHLCVNLRISHSFCRSEHFYSTLVKYNSNDFYSASLLSKYTHFYRAISIIQNDSMSYIVSSPGTISQGTNHQLLITLN